MAASGATPLDDETVRALREKSRTLSATIACRHSAEELWPYLTQVDLYNRAAGSSPAEYERIEMTGGGTALRATSRKLGLTMRYAELPYEWYAPEFVHAEMFFEGGPLRYGRVRGEYDSSIPGIRYTVDYVSRGLIPLGGLMARALLKKFASIIAGIDRRLPDEINDPLAAEGFADRSSAALRLRDELAKRWRHLASDEVISSLVADHVITAPENLVGRMRPYAIARQLGTPRDETLSFCLRATREGFLEMRWDLICPSCRGAKLRSARLADLDAGAHCDVCNIRYEADLAGNVEVSFRPAAALRRIDDREYCLQSPSHQRHVVAQMNIEPRATLRMSLSVLPGHYRMRALGMEGEAAFDLAFGRSPDEVQIRIRDHVDGSSWECGPSLTLVVENASDSWRTIRFERHGYREDAASALEVTACDEFRKYFADQTPTPSVIAASSPR